MHDPSALRLVHHACTAVYFLQLYGVYMILNLMRPPLLLSILLIRLVFSGSLSISGFNLVRFQITLAHLTMEVEALPGGHEQNRAALLLGIVWTECALSFVFVLCRFHCRKNITRNIWWDDWFILITFVSNSIPML